MPAFWSSWCHWQSLFSWLLHPSKMNILKAQQITVLLSSKVLSQMKILQLTSLCSFTSNMTILQLTFLCSFTSQWLQHLSLLLRLPNWLKSPQQWHCKQPQVFWIPKVSFCFTMKTAQKLWIQVSCCLSIETNQQLWWQLMQVYCCLSIKTNQQQHSHFSWLLKVFCFAKKTTQKSQYQVSCCFATLNTQQLPQ